MKNDLPQEMFDILYTKLQKLAREYADEKTKELSKYIKNGDSFCIHNPWVDLLKGYCEGRFNEEDVKYCFNLGYVTEIYLDADFKEYKIPHSRTKVRTPMIFEIIDD
jgi:hypothetical protein